MKFTCEKCGRSYVADEKVRGRSFRMKCKQCGHHIVVKPAALPTPPPGTIPAITPLPFFLGTPPVEEEETAAVDPEPQVSPAQMLEGIERAAPASGVSLPPPLPPRGSPPSGPPILTPVATRSPFATAPVAAPPAIELEESGRGAEPDPFATMAAELSAELSQIPEAPPLAPPDPFLAAPPLPPPPVAPKLSESEEAFADLSRMMDGTSGSRPLSVQGDTVENRRAPPAPVPEAVRPTPVPAFQGRRWAPIIGLGFGFGTIIAVGWLLASSDPVRRLAEPERPASAAPVAAAQEPAPRPTVPAPRAPEPAAAPVAAPAPTPAPPPVARAPEPEIAVPQAAPAPSARPQAPAPEKRAARPRRESPAPRKVAEARTEPARQATPPPPPPPSPPAQAAPPAQRAAAPAPEPAVPARASSPAAVAPAPATSNTDRPLDDKDIEATIRRYAKAFEGCVAEARKAEPQFLADQRRVTVTMTVNPNGRALYPTLDDQELSTTGLGACLKKEAGKMAFPEFAGEPVRVRIPLVLR